MTASKLGSMTGFDDASGSAVPSFLNRIQYFLKSRLDTVLTHSISYHSNRECSLYEKLLGMVFAVDEILRRLGLSRRK